MKAKLAVAAVLMMVSSQAAFATPSAQERVQEDVWAAGIEPRPMSGTRFVRTSYAEPANQAEADAIAWGLIAPRVDTVTPVRVVHQPAPQVTPTREFADVWLGLEPMKLSFRSEAAGEPVKQVN
ncbi:MAG: hypothetical protein JJU06_04370 [Ectothiorhodospiraceae bacterium]|nr:hypothetical protein [Ectothiorhodospiraceae bacterium]MCH8505014.1 hypothetical protein [Ectothiorhodospiraceae bacterium]